MTVTEERQQKRRGDCDWCAESYDDCQQKRSENRGRCCGRCKHLAVLP